MPKLLPPPKRLLLLGAGASLVAGLLARRISKAGHEAHNEQVSAHHQVLERPAVLRALIERMRRNPAYRPAGFSPGEAGIREAEQQLRDAEAALQGVGSEGDE